MSNAADNLKRSIDRLMDRENAIREEFIRSIGATAETAHLYTIIVRPGRLHMPVVLGGTLEVRGPDGHTHVLRHVK